MQRAERCRPDTSFTGRTGYIVYTRRWPVPWKETGPLEERKQFVLASRSHDVSHAALCASFGISRPTGYKWIARFKKRLRWEDLEDRSRRPHGHPDTTPARIERLVIARKRKHPTWGPRKLRTVLLASRPRVSWPSVSTIGAILKRAGLVEEIRRHFRRPPRTKPFTACRAANDTWCIDFKGQFRTADGRLCYPLTVMDAATRYLLACVAFTEPTLENVRRVVEELFKKYGLPKAIRSDNGEPFASMSTPAGLTRLSVGWAKLGIRLDRIDPGKPQQNGRHERMHRTLKLETCTPPRRSHGWQQRAFDRFRDIYNTQRPHEALGMKTPASLYKASTIPMPPLAMTPSYPFADCHVVRADGTIEWDRGRFFLSTVLAGELVGLYDFDDRYKQIVFTDLDLGLIDTKQLNLGLIRPRKNSRSPRNRDV